MYDGCSNFGKCENHGCPEFGQKCTVDTEALYFVFKSVQSPNAQKEDESFIFSQSVFFHFKVKKIHYQPLPNALDIIDCCDQPDYWPSWSKTPYGLKPLL